MRIQKRLVRRDKENVKPFYKFMINLPPIALSKLKWKDGMDLDYKISGKKLILQRK